MQINLCTIKYALAKNELVRVQINHSTNGSRHVYIENESESINEGKSGRVGKGEKGRIDTAWKETLGTTSVEKHDKSRLGYDHQPYNKRELFPDD